MKKRGQSTDKTLVPKQPKGRSRQQNLSVIAGISTHSIAGWLDLMHINGGVK